MSQIGNVTEINEVKQQLETLKEKGLVRDWELPYENILTRLTAAIFFLTPNGENQLEEIWKTFNKNTRFQFRENTENKLSQLAWRLEFNKGFEL